MCEHYPDAQRTSQPIRIEVRGGISAEAGRVIADMIERQVRESDAIALPPEPTPE
jgi:hypothetical protein